MNPGLMLPFIEVGAPAILPPLSYVLVTALEMQGGTVMANETNIFMVNIPTYVESFVFCFH